jgi:hypothetical protein
MRGGNAQRERGMWEGAVAVAGEDLKISVTSSVGGNALRSEPCSDALAHASAARSALGGKQARTGFR